MHNKTLNEGLQHKDMEGLIKQTIHIDEFEAKMGPEEEICVVSFYVRNTKVADDLIGWFERGYDFILDADRSPGEVQPNRYLVYVELKRRTSIAKWLHEILYDLGTLCEFDKPEEWIVSVKDQEFAFSKEAILKNVITSPQDFREENESDLNEMREIAGLPTKTVHNSKEEDIQALKNIAGL